MSRFCCHTFSDRALGELLSEEAEAGACIPGDRIFRHDNEPFRPDDLALAPNIRFFETVLSFDRRPTGSARSVVGRSLAGFRGSSSCLRLSTRRMSASRMNCNTAINEQRHRPEVYFPRFAAFAMVLCRILNSSMLAHIQHGSIVLACRAMTIEGETIFTVWRRPFIIKILGYRAPRKSSYRDLPVPLHTVLLLLACLAKVLSRRQRDSLPTAMVLRHLLLSVFGCLFRQPPSNIRTSSSFTLLFCEKMMEPSDLYIIYSAYSFRPAENTFISVRFCFTQIP